MRVYPAHTASIATTTTMQCCFYQLLMHICICITHMYICASACFLECFASDAVNITMLLCSVCAWGSL